MKIAYAAQITALAQELSTLPDDDFRQAEQQVTQGIWACSIRRGHQKYELQVDGLSSRASYNSRIKAFNVFKTAMALEKQRRSKAAAIFTERRAA